MYHYKIGSSVNFSGEHGGVIRIIKDEDVVSLFKLIKEKENT
jgi:hypothetical protein